MNDARATVARVSATRKSPEPALPAPGLLASGTARFKRGRALPMSQMALAMLVVATMLFALGPSLLKSLMNIAAGVGLAASGLSYCNVLFVGNLCAGLVTLLVTKPHERFTELTRLPRRTLLYLALGAIVSTIHPALLYTALERTSVINIVLLSRFNGIVYVVIAAFFLRATVTRSEVLGYVIMGAGVVTLLFVNNAGLRITLGDGLVLLATVFFAISEIVSKRVLAKATIQTYVFFRNLVSALIFFVIGLYVFGFEHFAEAFSGDLWLLMVLYASISIVVAQAAWLRAIRVLPVRAVANSQLLNPIFSLLFAFLLLGEVPTGSQSFVIVLVLVGMVIPRIKHRNAPMQNASAMSIDTSLVGR